jgi:PTS system fructose-specific IIC component
MAQSPKKKDRKATVRDLVPSDLFVKRLEATTREGAITELLNVLCVHGVLDIARERAVVEQMLEREKVASTGIGNGIAIPHAKNKFATRFGVSVGLSEEGVEFGAHDSIPAFVVALWVCPPAATQEHLAWMRGLATLAKDPNLAGTLSGAKDKKHFLSILEEVELDK